MFYCIEVFAKRNKSAQNKKLKYNALDFSQKNSKNDRNIS